MNSAVPITTVMASASTGDITDITFEGSGRASSLSMFGLLCRAVVSGTALVPQAAHPLADLRDRGLRGQDARRDLALRDHDEPVADLEQLVEFLADDQQCAALVA